MRVVFFGTPEFALVSLEALIGSRHEVVGVVTQPDRPKGRRHILTSPPVKVLALSQGFPVWQPEHLRGPDLVGLLRDLAPDVVTVVAYGKIFPSLLLELPRYGCINLHASLLPSYRGAAPIHWTIINGEAETGATTMFMAPQLDAGDIILQQAVAIGPTETTGQLHDRLATLGASLLVETLDLLEEGRAPRRPQDQSRASYAPVLKAEDEHLDWRLPGRAVFNRIRGLNPWPGAYAIWRGRRIKIWEGEPVAVASEPGFDPGQVISSMPEGLEVACGTGQALLIKRLQPEGKGMMTASSFSHGYSPEKGELFS